MRALTAVIFIACTAVVSLLVDVAYHVVRFIANLTLKIGFRFSRVERWLADRQDQLSDWCRATCEKRWPEFCPKDDAGEDHDTGTASVTIVIVTDNTAHAEALLEEQYAYAEPPDEDWSWRLPRAEFAVQIRTTQGRHRDRPEQKPSTYG